MTEKGISTLDIAGSARAAFDLAQLTLAQVVQMAPAEREKMDEELRSAIAKRNAGDVGDQDAARKLEVVRKSLLG